jgi:hypothetical protein
MINPEFKQPLLKGLIILICIFSSNVTYAADEVRQQVLVAEPFIEFHTGPGRGYPVFHIVEKNEKITIIKKKTQWYKVKSSTKKLGWVHENNMNKTLNIEGGNYKTGTSDQKEFVNRDFEAGVLGGDFGGATTMSLYGGWNWTPNISTELAFSQAVGNVSEIQYVSMSIMHQPFPEWRVSPYAKIGGGIILTKPNATLILTEDRQDEMLHAGVGVRFYISRQFFIRAEYNSHTILTSRNDNDEVEEWKLGFSVFF